MLLNSDLSRVVQAPEDGGFSDASFGSTPVKDRNIAIVKAVANLDSELLRSEIQRRGEAFSPEEQKNLFESAFRAFAKGEKSASQLVV